MNIIIFCLLAAAGAALVLFFRGRMGGPKKVDAKIYLLIHDGAAFVLYDAVRANGCFLVDGIEYPTSACRPVELACDVRLHVYVFAAEPLALVTHQQLMKNRASVVKGHLFKGGGDMTRTINMVAAGAVVACAIFVYMSVGSLNAADVQQQVILEELRTWSKSPLVIER